MRDSVRAIVREGAQMSEHQLVWEVSSAHVHTVAMTTALFNSSRLTSPRPSEAPASTKPLFALEALGDAELVGIIASFGEAVAYGNHRQAEAALGMLWDRHAGSVAAIARRVLRDPGLAEEVVQDCFMKLWQRAGDYSPSRGSVPAWLATMAHHASIDALRRRAVRPQAFDDDEAAERHPDPRDLAERALEAVNLERILGRLVGTERQLLELAFLDGLTHVQVAAQTGLPLGTVKSRIRSALKRLQGQLQGQ
jgi:RNA polymerase sigma-70 factor, ECF subfamily